MRTFNLDDKLLVINDDDTPVALVRYIVEEEPFNKQATGRCELLRSFTGDLTEGTYYTFILEQSHVCNDDCDNCKYRWECLTN